MPRPTKTEVLTDFRRRQILDAARQNFTRYGVADTSVDGIAKSAGVAKGTVYLYYASKDELLQQILSEDLQEFHRATVPAIGGSGTIDARVAAFLRATLEFFERKREFFEHCHQEMTPGVRKKAKQQFGQVFAAQTDAWRQALEAGGTEVRAADRGGTARGIVAMAYGLSLQRMKGWYSDPIDDIVACASALVLKGLTR